MTSISLNLLLADDDLDDCNLFKEALEELSLASNLVTVHDGVELMNFLELTEVNLPHIVFLDLNMPLKSGFECLSEIKINDQLNHLPVIILSTSLTNEMEDLMYEYGAHYYIQKPGTYSKLKKAIFEAITYSTQNNFIQPSRDQFVLPT